MAKLEELTELLVTEIRDFENEVQKLERIQKEGIGLDTTEIRSLLLSHQQLVEKNKRELSEQMEWFHSKMDSAKIYPKWAVILFVVSLCLNCTLVLIGVIYHRMVL